MKPVKKVFTPVGVTFKGGGFYKTDSRGKSSSTSPSTGGGSDSSSGDSKGSSNGSSGDAKSESKSDTNEHVVGLVEAGAGDQLVRLVGLGLVRVLGFLLQLTVAPARARIAFGHRHPPDRRLIGRNR